MLTSLPDRFHFPAIGLSGFRVPQISRTVQVPVWLFILPGLTFHCASVYDNGDLRSFLCRVKLLEFREKLAVHQVQ